MFLYAVKNKFTNELLSVKSRGGKFFRREGDARKHVDVFDATSPYVLAKFELVEVPNGTKVKGKMYVYQNNWSVRYFQTKSRSWSESDYKTYEVLEV